jgi:hypothetical protein
MKCGVHGKSNVHLVDCEHTDSWLRQVEQHSKEDYAKKACQWAKGALILKITVAAQC